MTNDSKFDTDTTWLANFLAKHDGGTALEDLCRERPDLVDRFRALAKRLECERAGGGGGPPTRFGDFRILREIGRGGMGVVYEAVQEPLGRRVAVKAVTERMRDATQFLERFLREARASARLHHTNIVPVFQVGVADGIHYFAMQYIDGEPLQASLSRMRAERKNGPKGEKPPTTQKQPDGDSDTHFISPADSFELGPTSAPKSAPSTALGGPDRPGYFKEVAALVAPAADALAHAHSEGVLHRDVKPGNLLLERDGKLWVTDFGIAKDCNDVDLTVTGQLLGTRRYIAPERLEGNSDARSDVYSLGATLYELVALKPAIEGADEHAILARIEAGDFPTPSAAAGVAVPLDLETIILKAMARRPEDRYQTASALAEDLRAFAADRPIAARRLTWIGKSRRWARRNPVAATLVALLFCSLAAGTAISTGLWLRAERARGRAVAAAAEQRRVLDFFLENVLAAARPKGEGRGQGVDVSVRAAVDAAAARIADYSFEPAVEADLRGTLGLTYYHLGEFQKMVEQNRRAWELRAAEFGPDDPRTLVAQKEYASSLCNGGRIDEGVGLFEATLAARRRLGHGPAEIADGLRDLGNWYGACNRSADGEKLLSAAHALRAEAFGETDRETLNYAHDVANARIDLGRAEEAIPLLRRTFDLQRAAPGKDAPDCWRTLGTLARGTMQSGRAAASLPPWEQALEGHRRIYGPESKHTQNLQRNYALSLTTAGQAAKAIPLQQELLRLRTASEGERAAETLAVASELGNSYVEVERIDAAIDLLSRTYETARIALATWDGTRRRIMLNLGRAKARRKDESAVPLLTEAVELFEKHEGPDATDTLMALEILAIANAYLGRPAKAFERLEAVYAMHAARGPKLATRRAGVVRELIRAHLDIAPYTGACPELAAARDPAKGKPSAGAQKALARLRALAEEALRLERAEIAEPAFRDLVAIYGRLDPDGEAAEASRRGLAACAKKAD
ncbi:MAG TPA: serine/threonine-protein kinase [Planctomycetia bacterium]|nr:serine/threonine-protein kinase [Planctomycetia bacterium]